MRIVSTGRLGSDDDYMLLLEAEQLNDLMACVDIACELIEYCNDHPTFLKGTDRFRHLPTTFDRRGLRHALKAEFQQVVR